MRAVNLLTPDLRSAPKGKGSSGPSAHRRTRRHRGVRRCSAPSRCAWRPSRAMSCPTTSQGPQGGARPGRAQSAATVAQATKLKPYADFQTLAQARAGTVQALASARFDWEQALRDLSRAMPKEVYLSSLDGTSRRRRAAPPCAARSTSPAIELKGCTKSQPAVAGLMSRMRNVQGVTRVSLAKSDKDTGALGAGAGGHRHGQPLRQGRTAVLRDRDLLRALGSRRRPRRRHRRRRPGRPAAAAPRRRRQRPAPASRARRNARAHQSTTAHRGDHRRYPVSRRNSMLLAGVVAVAAVAAYWMLALAPKREEAACSRTSIAAKQGELKAAEAELATYEQARRPATRPTTSSSPGSARPSRPTTTSAR